MTKNAWPTSINFLECAEEDNMMHKKGVRWNVVFSNSLAILVGYWSQLIVSTYVESQARKELLVNHNLVTD